MISYSLKRLFTARRWTDDGSPAPRVWITNEDLATLVNPDSGKVHAHICHDVLAGLYLANGDRESAKRNWEEGRTFAQTVGRMDYVAVCSSSLAQVYEGESQFDAAERELEFALGHEPDATRRAAILDHVKTLIAGYKKPKYIFVVETLPRNSLGKVLKRELREQLPPLEQ